MLRSLFLMVLVFGSFASRLDASGVQKVKEKALLRVGIEPGPLAFSMRSSADVWSGFDVVMMRAFCAKLKVKCEFVSWKWDGIISALIADKFDILCSDMTITPERSKRVQFSDPYYESGLRIMVGKDKSFKSFADLDRENVIVTVKRSTTGDAYATKNLKKAKIKRMDSSMDGAEAVALGRGDAFIHDRPNIEVFVASRGGNKVRILPDVLSVDQIAVAATKKNKDLIDAFNVFLKEWKENGGYDKAYKAFFDELLAKKALPQK